tara:strand:+ start:1490 stop:1675 length:186 start_codon:yes stop_codon:yes gene_type:complete
MKEYYLKIKYNPETEEIESIQEYIEEESSLKLMIDDEDLKAPNSMIKMIIKYCHDGILGLS